MTLCSECNREGRTDCWFLSKDEHTTSLGDEFLSAFPIDSERYQRMLEVNQGAREGNMILARQRGCTMIPNQHIDLFENPDLDQNDQS